MLENKWGINLFHYIDYRGIRLYRYQASFDGLTEEEIESIAKWLIDTFNFQDIDIYKIMKGWILIAWHNYYPNNKEVLHMRDITPKIDEGWKRLNPNSLEVRCSPKYKDEKGNEIKDIKHFKTIKGSTVPFQIYLNNIEITSEEMFEIGEKEKRKYEKWIG